MGLIHRAIRQRGRRVVLAIDNPRYGIGLISDVIQEARDVVAGFKLGVPLIAHYGLRSLSTLVKEFPDAYFLVDLKLADIADVMAMTVEEVHRYGFNGIVAHAFIGVEGALDKLTKMCKELGLDLILQTSMTHSGSILTIDKVLPEIKSIINAVDPDGLIAAANKPEIIKDLRTSLGWKYIILSPGIMIKSVNPGEAICAGADAEIVGRLVLSAPNPKKALLDVISMQEEYLREHDESCLRP